MRFVGAGLALVLSTVLVCVSFDTCVGDDHGFEERPAVQPRDGVCRAFVVAADGTIIDQWCDWDGSWWWCDERYCLRKGHGPPSKPEVEKR